MTTLLFRRTTRLVPSKAALLLTAIVALACATAFSQEKRPETHLFLVDISESMWAKPNGLKAWELKLRQDNLKGWLTSHPNSQATLMSFNTGIRSKMTYDLRDSREREKAVQWADSLKIKRPRGTYLWPCVGKALETVSNLSHQQPGEIITLHVLTDGVDTQHIVSPGQLKRDFPEAKWPTNLSEPARDFDITIQTPPSPTPSPTSPPPGPTATPSASAGTTASPSTKFTPAPTATSTPTPTVKPTGTPTPTPTATPCPSVSPCDAKAAFEIQESRVVYEGDFVQFTNKSIPRADSYLWTITRNVPNSALADCDSEKGDGPRTSASEHWGYRFSNSCEEPQSYSVNLTAIYGATKVSATPVTVIVHRRPGERFWGPIPLPSVSELATLVTGIGTILTTIASFRKRTPDPNVPGSRERAQKARSRAIYFLIVFIVLFTFFATNSFQQTVGPRVPITPVNASAPTGFLPSVLPNSSTVVLRDGGTSLGFIAALSALVIVAILVVSVVIALRPRGSDDWRGRLADAVLPTGFGSLTARLIEIQRFEASGVFSKRQMRPFYRALFKELRRKHDVTPEQRRLSGTYKRLIERLVDVTQNGLLTWQTLSDANTPAETTTLGKQETADLSLATGPSLFGSRIDLSAEDPTADSIRIEVSDTNGSIRLRILNDNGRVMQSLDADSFNLDQETRDEIRRLYDVARDSALKIEKTLKTVVTKLDNDKTSQVDSPEKNS